MQWAKTRGEDSYLQQSHKNDGPCQQETSCYLPSVRKHLHDVDMFGQWKSKLFDKQMAPGEFRHLASLLHFLYIFIFMYWFCWPE